MRSNRNENVFTEVQKKAPTTAGTFPTKEESKKSERNAELKNFKINDDLGSVDKTTVDMIITVKITTKAQAGAPIETALGKITVTDSERHADLIGFDLSFVVIIVVAVIIIVLFGSFHMSKAHSGA